MKTLTKTVLLLMLVPAMAQAQVNAGEKKPAAKAEKAARPERKPKTDKPAKAE